MDRFASIVGNTPLILLQGPSALVPGRKIYAKVEFMNPASSIKDRVAAAVVSELAKREPRPRAVVEATAGNTGIALAVAARREGMKCIIFCSPATSKSKVDYLRLLGADVTICDSVPASDPGHFVARSQAYAAANPDCVLANQFFTLANPDAHADHTGKEIAEALAALRGPTADGAPAQQVAFVYAPGTGGTLCGVTQALHEAGHGRTGVAVLPPACGLRCSLVPAPAEDGCNKEALPLFEPDCDALREALADPRAARYTTDNPAVGRQWRALTDADNAAVTKAVAWTPFEGTGAGRMYASVYMMRPLRGIIDASASPATAAAAFRCCRALAATDGFVVGASSTLNVLSAVWTAQQMPEGSAVVTVLCDEASRYITSFHSEAFWRSALVKASAAALGAADDTWVEEQFADRNRDALDALLAEGAPVNGPLDGWWRDVWTAADVAHPPADVTVSF